MISRTPASPLALRKISDILYVLAPSAPVPDPLAMQLLRLGDSCVLFGVNPAYAFHDIFLAITGICPPVLLEAILIPELTMPIVSRLSELRDFGVKTTIVANAREYAGVLSQYPNIRIYNLADQPPLLILKSGSTLEFWLTPFVTEAQSFMVYFPNQELLLANHVFDYLREDATHDRMELVSAHQSNIIPSIDFLRPLLARIGDRAIQLAITRSGKCFTASEVAQLVEVLSQRPFYNYATTDGTIKKKAAYPYLEYANQVVSKLRSLHTDAEVRSVFANSAIAFDDKQMTIVDRGLSDYRLWQSLFDLIYTKKGVSWLALLEPMVNKLVALRKVEKPAIYQSASLSIERKVVELDTEKRELGTRLSSLENELQQTAERMLKDSLSGCYNQQFLEKHLLHRLETGRNQDVALQDIHLIFLTLDRITELNTKYGKNIGDETIRNLAFILKQTGEERDLIVKRNGPGFIIMREAADLEAIRQLAARIQAAVGKAEIFVEPVTVSIALTSLSELPQTETARELVDLLITTGENRIKLAGKLGTNTLVNGQDAKQVSDRTRILLVDDDEILIKLFRAYFAKANFDVSVCMDGQAGWEAATTGKFSAFIVAKILPKIDGFTLKLKLNEQSQTLNTHFILTTYNKTPETIIRANRLGIDAVLEKPLIFEEILGLMQRSMERN